VKVAVLPLVKDEKLIKIAKETYKDLKKEWNVMYDEVSSIGRRYRRQDEIGTPYAITIDFDTLKDKSVTIRDRDSMRQERIKKAELSDHLRSKIF
jgi:glycyl-tRNA synthetase